MKKLQGATAKHKAVRDALEKSPHLSDRQIAARVGASHTFVAKVRKLYGAFSFERIGDDGAARRLPLPKKPDHKRYTHEITTAAGDLARILEAAIEAYRENHTTDESLADTVRMARHVVAWKLDEAERIVGGKPIKKVGDSFTMLGGKVTLTQTGMLFNT